ncbi:MAG: radical SAM/SPASM domain-containing protein [Kiritimatiellia bacterium]
MAYLNRLYWSLGIGALARTPTRIWWNFLRYRVSIRRIRRKGPDVLPYTPPSVVIWTTLRCNRNCTFCHYHGELNPANAAELELDRAQFVRILDQPLVRNALRIALYGGEPLLSSDLFEMVSIARHRGHLVTINTNGTLLNERLEDIRRHPPDLFSIGCYPEELALLETALPRVSTLARIKLIALISRRTLPYLPRIVELAIRSRASALSFERVCPNSTNSEPPLTLDDPIYLGLKATLSLRYSHKIPITWPAPSAAPTCRFFWNSMFLDAQGRISPCCVWPLSTYRYSLFENPDVWNSAEMQTLRREMRTGNPDSRCRACTYLYDDPMGI